MKLVTIVRAPPHPDGAEKALAAATGLTAAEARMRLAPEPPALLARLDDDQADALVRALRSAGLAAIAVDVRCPTDADRFSVHRFSIEEAGGTFANRAGASIQVAWPEVIAILRGLRTSRTDIERTEKSRSFSLGRAVITGGLMVSKTSTTTTRTSSEEAVQVTLLYLRDGRCLSLAEQELEFSGLGPGMQPSRTANMAELGRRLRARAKGAFYDERLLRLGRRPLPFIGGGDSRSEAAKTVTKRSDTSGSLDILAEVIRQALVEGLLP